MAKKNEKKIIFVCTGNTCRSPMAEMLLRKALEERALQGFSVSSAGIAPRKGDEINSKSAQVLAEHGLAVDRFLAKALDDKSLREAFAVICMTEHQKDILLDMRWQALRKADAIGEMEIDNNVYMFSEFTGYSIIDPYGRDLDCYRYVYGLLAAGMPALIEKLRLPEYAKKTTPRKPKAAADPASPPKKRGRPKKEKAENSEALAPPKKRGRPKKTETENSL